MYNIKAFQVADSIKLKEFKAAYAGTLIFGDSDELFYETDKNKYLYVFRYGVVCFSNYSDIEISDFIKLVNGYSKNPLNNVDLCESFLIEENAAAYNLEYTKLKTNRITQEVFRITMLYVSQSAALDYYTNQAEEILEKSNQYTLQLEKHGAITQNEKDTIKFIGKTLNLRNKIVENLYILDTHPATWEDEFLNKLELDISKIFDLTQRFRNVSESLNIVKENLDLFKDLIHNKKSHFLEWVIVILILVEVVALMIERIF